MDKGFYVFYLRYVGYIFDPTIHPDLRQSNAGFWNYISISNCLTLIETASSV